MSPLPAHLRERLACPYCRSRRGHVLDTESLISRSEGRRRRECVDCQRRWTTRENPADPRPAFLAPVPPCQGCASMRAKLIAIARVLDGREMEPTE